MRSCLRLTLSALCALSLGGLAGCRSSPDDAPAPAPVAAAPVSAALPSADEDTCQAASYSSLIGKDHMQAPTAPEGKVIRVVCTVCPMTMDFSAERLNVFYDKDTGVITRLNCG